MRSSRVVRASGCHCQSRNSPGFDPSEGWQMKQRWKTYTKKRRKNKKQSTKCFFLSFLVNKKGKAVHLRRKCYAEVWWGLPWQTSAGPPSRSWARETPLGLFPKPVHKNTRRRIHVKDEWHWMYPVWRILDVYPGSRILIFTHPGSRIPDLGSRIQKQQWKIWLKKICCRTFFLES